MSGNRQESEGEQLAQGSKVYAAMLLVSRAVAFAVLAIYLPVLAMIAAVVVATSPGPAFIKKAYRRGAKEVVYLYEFRTECWQTWRETPVGALIRMMDMRRLPRLANAAMGEVWVGERVNRIAS